MVTPFFANKGFHPKLEVSLEPVVSHASHQAATDLKELHLYLCYQIAHSLKQYEVHSVLQCIVPLHLWTDMSHSWTGPLTLR